jgi:DNA polymerase-3 subunit gamma/tau
MFAPVQARYRVYIIDEAHQLSNAAANALLKLIEEPPAHLKFVFATTEPDKIIGTIRSRTHHYPFRLIPARVLQQHLAWVCEQEGVAFEEGALAVVARAAAGSARDSLSILGQVLAGSGPAGLVETDVVSQLGVTDRRILDDVIDALIAGNGQQLFASVNRVVDGGLEPRRFAGDLLERLRDLILLSHIPAAEVRDLIDAPDAAFAAMQQQAMTLGESRASAIAAVVSAGMSDLRGATAPRLQLELLCARLLSPTTESDALAERLNAIERRIDGLPVGVSSQAAAKAAVERAAVVVDASVPATSSAAAAPSIAQPPATRSRAVPPPPPISAVKRAPTAALNEATAEATTLSAGATTPAGTTSAAGATTPAGTTSAAGTTTAASVEQLAEISASWARVLDCVRDESRVSWSLLNGTSALPVTAGVLQVLMSSAAIVANAQQRGVDKVVQSAIATTFGAHTRIEFAIASADAALDETAGARDDDEEIASKAASVDDIARLLGGKVISEFEKNERS